MRTLRTVIFALTVVASGGIAAVGCGGDDTNNPNPKLDGSADSPAPPKDDGGGDENNNPPPDGGGDGGPRDFAAYVIDIITTKTSETTPPTKDLCDMCTDNQDKKDFKSLFP